MSLITAPPSILGGTVPHPGLAPTSINTLLINGTDGWKTNAADAATQISIAFNIDGTPNVIVQTEDPQRFLLRSAMGIQRSYIMIDGVTFVLAELDKAGPQMTLTFEHAVCSKLKDRTDTLSVRANTMSRTSFVAKLVSMEGWIQLLMPGGSEFQNSIAQLSTGNVDSSTGGALPLPYSTTFQEKQTFWDSIGTILSTIGWRRFPRGSNQLIVASDQWLYNQTPIATIDEDTPGVDTIDFNYDIRKPLGSVTVTCRAEAWAFPVGSVIAFSAKMGIVGIQSTVQERQTVGGQLPPIAGHWLVTNIARNLTDASATITLDTPLLQLTEPQTQPPTSPVNEVIAGLSPAQVKALGGGISLPGGAQSGKSASSKIAQFVAFAKSKVGGPYVWGGSGPIGYDCSGLVQGAAAAIGVSLEHNSVAIYNQCMAAKSTCTPETAIKTYGALLFIAPGTNGEPPASQGGGHIAISLGNNTTVEATGTAEGICYNTHITGEFNQGALLPGIAY
jgi:cell wall-associated NlpC family hydrolase